MVKPQKVLSILNSLRGYREKLGQLAAIPEAEFLRRTISCPLCGSQSANENPASCCEAGFSFYYQGRVKPPITFAAAATLRPTGR